MTDHDTDHDTDRHAGPALTDREGDLTGDGWEQVQHWCLGAERELEQVARHGMVAVAVVDIVGLPALFWVTSWSWPAVLAAWVAGVALVLALACLRHEHARAVRLRRIERRLDAARRPRPASPALRQRRLGPAVGPAA